HGDPHCMSCALPSLCPPPISTLFPYTTLFRSTIVGCCRGAARRAKQREQVRIPTRPRTVLAEAVDTAAAANEREHFRALTGTQIDRKSTRLNSSHVKISYAVFCLKKKKKKTTF